VSNEIDPNWPPPKPKESCERELTVTPPAPRTSDRTRQSSSHSAPSATAPVSKFSSPQTTGDPQTPGRQAASNAGRPPDTASYAQAVSREERLDRLAVRISVFLILVFVVMVCVFMWIANDISLDWPPYAL
jgi:hypothetical protein